MNSQRGMMMMILRDCIVALLWMDWTDVMELEGSIG